MAHQIADTAVILATALKFPRHRDHDIYYRRPGPEYDSVLVLCSCGDRLLLDGPEVMAQRGRELADGPRRPPPRRPSAPREPNVIREALSSLPPPPPLRSSVVAGLEAIEEDLKKLHEQWAREYTGEWGVDLSLPPSGPAMVPPPVDRSAPKQWPIGRYIEENDKLRARAAKAEKEREAALATARAAREALETRSDAIGALAHAQRTIAVQRDNIAALDDELKAARARPPGMCIPGCVRDDPHARARCIVPPPAPPAPLEPPPPGEWKLDPTWLPPMKVREYRVLPPVYGTVQLDAEALEACRGDSSAFMTADELAARDALRCYAHDEPGCKCKDGPWRPMRGAVAAAAGIAPKRRARPYHQAVLYCQNEED